MLQVLELPEAQVTGVQASPAVVLLVSKEGAKTVAYEEGSRGGTT